MKPACEWKRDLEMLPRGGREAVRVTGRGGEPTLQVGGVYLHSRYNPRDEARRFVDCAEVDLNRPVLVVGLGLGYHVLELAARGAEVAVVEPNPAVARHALEGAFGECDIPLAVGTVDSMLAEAGGLGRRLPQLLTHPATATVEPEFTAAFSEGFAYASLCGQRLSVAVVGPMYGGSLPIAGYLERAFRKLGHRTLLVDNDAGWQLYQRTSGSVAGARPKQQLTGMLSNFLSEWSYARVAEFGADVCIVLAQAPVNNAFPARLAHEGIATAFWFVENGRHMGYWREIAPLYDYFFHIQPGAFEAKLREAGCGRQAVVPTGCDPEVHRPVVLSDEERAAFACDLSFAGAPYRNRVQLFQGLTDYNFNIWGTEWPTRELQRLVQRPGERFTAELFTKIVAGSKINLNLHSSALHEGIDPECDAINPRVFEIAACGGFQLCDPAIGLGAFFEFERELPVYRGLSELRARIDYYLQRPDERAQIAAAARARALREHTYAHRAQQMLGLLLEACGQRLLRKGIRIQRTAAELASHVADEQLRGFFGSLPPELLVTQDAINAHLESPRNGMSYPEKVFVYLREVRRFAETLLAARR
jgi:spore maturation protein CgeB